MREGSMNKLQRMIVACTALFRKKEQSGLHETEEFIGEQKTFHYMTYGTCSKEIEITLRGDVVERVCFIGGCPGGLEGIAMLVSGMKIEDVINKMQGVSCRNETSCPDQLAKALVQIQAQQSQLSANKKLILQSEENTNV